MSSRLPNMQVDGIAAWGDGLPDWSSMRAFARGEGELLPDAPRRPAPDLLAANERRRAPAVVLLALEVAQTACRNAGVDPATVPSIFTSTHGDLSITDYMCETLARAPAELSPIRFHNSVHNAAAGYWTIGSGCNEAATAISAFDASFAQGLLEAATQLACGAGHVLLVAYDGPSEGPLAAVSRSAGLLGVALLLSVEKSETNGEGRPVLRIQPPSASAAPVTSGRLFEQFSGNAMAPALHLMQALAQGDTQCLLHAGPEQTLAVEIRA